MELGDGSKQSKEELQQFEVYPRSIFSKFLEPEYLSGVSLRTPEIQPPPSHGPTPQTFIQCIFPELIVQIETDILTGKSNRASLAEEYNLLWPKVRF